ncbi:hypothetical protein [Pseudophaeobacter sp.]|uniref:hypothetical protein n=1 Tax=Pseudophaeobacter sp. TaxID=1971739 RepID=UPI004059E931
MNSHKTDSLQKLPQEELQLLLVRYTLRAFPAVNPDTSAKSFDEVFFLRHARTLLAMCCFVTESSPEIRRAAQHAASSAREYEPFKLQTATSIAIKSAADALLLKDAKKKKQKAIKTIELIPFSDFHAQAQRDLDTIRKTSTSAIIFDRPLWTHPVEIMDPYQPLPFPDLEEVVLQLGFWQDWYKGFLDGKPLDWELQRRVALIDDAIWEAGPEAVAAQIERIKEDFATTTSEVQDRFPEYEPKSVNHLIENRVLASASLQGLSVQISDEIAQYHAETGANALPDAFQPLSDMPILLNTLAATLQGIPSSGEASAETEQRLREENGRLNAKVAELQGELATLKLKLENLSEADQKGILFWFQKNALWGMLPVCLWAFGEDLEIRNRYENMINNKEEIRQLLMQEGLPQTQVQKSLRPFSRPGRA